MTTLGGIKTGPVSTIKAESSDANVLTTAEAEKAKQEADKAITKVNNDQVIYKTVGYDVFNCRTAKGFLIQFAGGAYIVEKSDPMAAEIIEALDYHVKMRRITKQ